MNYAQLRTHDVANGPGVRVSLFVSGCTHRCPGCFNSEAWAFDYGEKFDGAVVDRIIESLAPSYIKGFSLLGGEPFEPSNQRELAPLLERIKQNYPHKTVWCYTGYDFEKDILTSSIGDVETVRRMIANIDVLVDGKFIMELKDLSLRFRGSSNQRIIDVPRSMRLGKAVLAEEFN